MCCITRVIEWGCRVRMLIVVASHLTPLIPVLRVVVVRGAVRMRRLSEPVVTTTAVTAVRREKWTPFGSPLKKRDVMMGSG